MGDCCEDEPPVDARVSCPRCGDTGRAVGGETIAAILAPGTELRALATAPRFCRTPSCEVLYYGSTGGFVAKDSSRVRVGLKETADPIPLCYCFGFTLGDVCRELADTGACTIPERISAEIAAGRCSCEVKNPSGGCCLPEVIREVRGSR